MNYTKQLMGIGSVLGMGFGAMTMWKSAIFYGKRKISLFASKRKTTKEFVIHLIQLLFFVCILVEPGHRAFKFNKFSGVQENIMREGWHIKMPYFERPIIYDVRTHPKQIQSRTGSKGKSPSI